MKLKKKNKGFSLVELIVVMAIMAILAVMLAPRLIQYVEKSKTASDQNVIDTVYNTTKLTLVDEAYLTAFKSGTPHTTTGVYVVDFDTFYGNSNGVFAADDTISNTAFAEIASVMDDFKLKSKLATSSSDIVIVYDSVNDNVTALLDYDGIANFSTPATPTTDEISNLLRDANYKITE